MSQERRKVYTVHPDGRQLRVIESKIISETEDTYIIWSDEFHMTALPKTETHWGFTEKEALARYRGANAAPSSPQQASQGGAQEGVYEVSRGKDSLGQFTWDELVARARSGELLPTDFLTMEGSFMSHQASSIQGLWDQTGSLVPPHLNERDITHPKQIGNVLNALNIIKYLQRHNIPHEVVGQGAGVRVSFRGEEFTIVTRLAMPRLEVQVDLVRELECNEACDAAAIYPICNSISQTHRYVKAYFEEGKLVLKVEMLCRNMRQFEFAFKRAAREMHAVLRRFE